MFTDETWAWIEWLIPYAIGLIILFFAVKGVYPLVKRVTRDTCINHVTGLFSMKRIMTWIAYWIGIAACMNDFVYLSFSPVFEFHFAPVSTQTKLILFGVGGFNVVNTIIGQYQSRKQFDNTGRPLAKIVTKEEVEQEKIF